METYRPNKIRLRLNTSARNDLERWRLEIDGVEVKVANVAFVGCEVVTEEMILETGEIKYCIACNDADFVHIEHEIARVIKA